jgi:O-antigen ligase
MSINLTEVCRDPFGLVRGVHPLPGFAAVLVAGLGIGAFVAFQPLPVTGVLVAGLLALLITLARPVWALGFYFCGVLMMGDGAPMVDSNCFFIADPDMIEGLPSLLTVVFLMIFGIVAMRLIFLEQRFPPISLLPLGIYIIVLAFALLTGLYRETDSELIQADFIGLLIPVVSFYLCSTLLDSRAHIAGLLAALLAVSAVKASILAGYYLAGRGWIYQLDNNPAYRITTTDSADLLVFITLPLVVAHLIVRGDLRGGKAAAAAVACAPLLYVVVFSYRRAQWVGLIFSLGLLYLGAAKAVRRKMMLLLLVVSLLGGAFAVTAGLDADKAQRFVDRLSSILDRKQSSNVYHALESRQVLLDLSESPLFGLGLGSRHSPLGLYAEDEVPTNVVHNAFLYIWMKMGLPGLFFFLWFAERFFREILRFRRAHGGGREWGLVLPLAASTGLWLALFLTGPVPWYVHQTVLIALFAAMTGALIRQAEEKHSVEGESK